MAAKRRVQQCRIKFLRSLWCPFPLQFDTYQGCSHDCGYCSAKLQRRTPFQRTVHIARGLDDLKAQLSGKKFKAEYKLLQEGLTFQWGCVADPFPAMEQKTRNSLNALRIFAHLKMPFIVCTKSVIPGQPEYMEQFKKMGDQFMLRMSMSTLEDDLGKRLEPGAPLASERMALTRALKERGHKSLLRVSPFIPEVTMPEVTVERAAEFLKKCKPNCGYVTFKLLNVDTRSRHFWWEPFFNNLGIDGKAWIDKYAVEEIQPGAYGPSIPWRVHWMKTLREAADQVGIRIGFENTLGTFAEKMSDGVHCCDIGEPRLPFNPDAITPMIAEGRISNLEFKRTYSLPEDFYEGVRGDVQALAREAKSIQDKLKAGAAK